jgi:hypothetical protein
VTPLLARAFAEASRLPADEQDALAAFVLATLAEHVPATVHEPPPARGFRGADTHAAGERRRGRQGG